MKKMESRIYEATFNGKSGVRVDIKDPTDGEWELNSFFPDGTCKPSDLLKKFRELTEYDYKVQLHK